MCFFTKTSRSGFTFILDLSFFDVAALSPVVDEDNFRAFRSLALVVEVLALAALTVDAGPGDAGCVCADRWDCPLWCWLRWLRSLALVVEVLASVALTVDAGPGDAGCVCADRWDCPLWCWLR